MGSLSNKAIQPLPTSHMNMTYEARSSEATTLRSKFEQINSESIGETALGDSKQSRAFSPVKLPPRVFVLFLTSNAMGQVHVR